MRIYILEDNAAIRDSLLLALAQQTPLQTVAYAETEEEGARWLARKDARWDLAIVDLFLKTGSGLRILEACRYRHPQQKMVVLSNHATKGIRWRCAQLGADAVFDKTTELDALIRYCVIVAEKLERDAKQLYHA